jgi:hypothetical protein
MPVYAELDNVVSGVVNQLGGMDMYPPKSETLLKRIWKYKFYILLVVVLFSLSFGAGYAVRDFNDDCDECDENESETN